MRFDPTQDQPSAASSVPPSPVNWNLLTAVEAEEQWLALNAWLNWLRRTYGLPAAVLPPLWHRHPELVWELSALHTHWLTVYDRHQSGSGPVAWHHDFALAQQRLRDWTATSGTRLDRDRPTRQTIWPGEVRRDPIEEAAIPNRDEDFVAFVLDDVRRRQKVEDEFIAAADDDLPQAAP